MSSKQPVLAVSPTVWKRAERSKRKATAGSWVLPNSNLSGSVKELLGESWETGLCDKQINRQTLPE